MRWTGSASKQIDGADGTAVTSPNGDDALKLVKADGPRLWFQCGGERIQMLWVWSVWCPTSRQTR